jgi:hypothetical protein
MMRAGSLVSLTLTTMTVASAACGGDDDGGAVYDAAAVIDSAPLPDAREGSNFWLLSCGPDPEFDAGPPPEFDAGTPDAGIDAGPPADAGLEPPPGFGDPCCDPDGVCPSGLECIGDSDKENATCRPVCIGDDNLQCPFGGVCARFGGQMICIPASGDGAECDPELCEDGFLCVGTSSDDATCRKKCMVMEDCGEGQECQVVSNGMKACL